VDCTHGQREDGREERSLIITRQFTQRVLQHAQQLYTIIIIIVTRQSHTPDSAHGLVLPSCESVRVYVAVRVASHFEITHHWCRPRHWAHHEKTRKTIKSTKSTKPEYTAHCNAARRGPSSHCYKLEFHGTSFPRRIFMTSSRGYRACRRGSHEDATRKLLLWNLGLGKHAQRMQ